MNIVQEDKLIIGIDIGGTSIRSALLSKEAEIFFNKSIRTRPSRSAISIFKDIDLLIKECEEKAWDRGSVISGIGIILPGYPDERGNVFFIPNIPSLKNFPIKEYLHKDRDIPVVIENDGNASAYGEYIFGQEKKYKNIIVLTLERAKLSLWKKGLFGGLFFHLCYKEYCNESSSWK